jgi:putative peptidoglycan lipid II flippase
MVRDMVRAALVGAGRLSDSLDVAFKVPNLLRDLFAEGAFSGAFVPTLSHTREHDGDRAAFDLLNRVLSTMIVYVGAIVGLLVWFAPGIVGALAPAFAPEYFDLTVVLVRLLAPFLLLICLAVVAMGALNVFGKFFVPALAPATQNLILVAGGMVLVRLALGPAQAAIPWAVLLLCGGALQFCVQVPALLRAGWRPHFSPDLAVREPETRQILRRMLPVVGGLAATHLCILINTRLATADGGGTSNLYYAFRLVHLPVGLVGVAVGTAVLTEASRRAARNDLTGVRDTLGEALLLTLALCLPAAVGLAVLGEPIARLLFFWGATTPGEAAAIGDTIRYYSVAVVFYASVKVLAPVFYAQGVVRIPLFASLTAVAANLAFALALHPTMRWRALALAVGVGQAANLAVLLWAARRRFGGPSKRVVPAVTRISLAGACSGGAAWLTLSVMPEGRLVRALIPIASGAMVYFFAGKLLKSPEIAAVSPVGWLDKRRNRP